MTSFFIPGTTIKVSCTLDFLEAVSRKGVRSYTTWDYIDLSNKDDIYDALAEGFRNDGLGSEWELSISQLGYLDPCECISR